jgi:predicted dehydrogenase
MAIAAARLSSSGQQARDRQSPQVRPRLGFLGVGWIGLNRMQAVAANGAAEVVCIADAAPECAETAVAAVHEKMPRARALRGLEQLLSEDLDGVVIATPSGLHASQATAVLARGLPVFCQKPLARTAQETASVVEAARAHDRLLAVDFCYRTVAGVSDMANLAISGALGQVYAADLVFHNAYGPDKPWFYDLEQSGGGCVMDLGSHLIDLLLWVLGNPPVAGVTSRLHANGSLLRKPAEKKRRSMARRVP